MNLNLPFSIVSWKLTVLKTGRTGRFENVAQCIFLIILAHYNAEKLRINTVLKHERCPEHN